jgi:hypothetical protein
VITRGDSGKREFNFSEIFGGAIAGGISEYAYHPRDDRSVESAVSVWTTQLAWDTLSIELKEFWPDIRRKLSHKKHSADQPQSSSVSH